MGLTGALLLALIAGRAGAAEPAAAAPQIDWSAKDIRGNDVKVPAANAKASVVLFVLTDQPQSQQALQQLRATITDQKAAGDVQVLVVVSGQGAVAGATKLSSDAAAVPWPVVPDPEYTASGKLSVHVWPTTVIVRGDGQQVAHLPGLPTTYARDLDGYVAFAAGRIDHAELLHRLGNNGNVLDSTQQMAARHLEVARRLLEKDMPEQANVELQKAIDLKPKSPLLRLSIVDMLLSLNQGPAALQMLDQIQTDQVEGVPAWQIKLIRGRALVASGQWDQAKQVLSDAVKLNPEPAAAYYELGQVLEHQSDWQAAADAYRRAYEATRQLRKTTLSPVTP
jgi:tetratricopeptide (TPR) repeat protein